MKYLLVWSGGLEMPSYYATDNYDDAKYAMKRWEKDIGDTDYIQLLDVSGPVVEVLETIFRDPESP